jgi:hypothetical protein
MRRSSLAGIVALIQRRSVLSTHATRRLLDWHRGIAERPRYWRSRPGAAPNTAGFDRPSPLGLDPAHANDIS